MLANERAPDCPYRGGVVTTRGSFRIGPFNLVYPRIFGGSGDYRTDDVPGFDDDCVPDEIAVFVHGFLVSEAQAETTFSIVRDTLDYYGYDHPLVGFTWDADRVLAIDDWYPTVRIAQSNGGLLASFLAAYRRANPDTSIRLIGHSLGAQVALSALTRLSRRSWSGTVANVALLGAAVDDDLPSLGWREYGDAIREVAGAVTNYHSPNDDRLRYYRLFEYDDPLGRQGVEGETPANYTDRPVPFVENHLNYYREQVGCLDLALRKWGSPLDP